MVADEGTRITNEAQVVCLTPDVCMTPLGSLVVPVPYQIIGTFESVEETANTVRFTNMEAFTVDSRITEVFGDEPGNQGGLVSTTNTGYCRAVTHSRTVRVDGGWVVQNNSLMEMNCNGPEGPGNTIGRVVYVKITETTFIADDGDIVGETNPPIEPETEEEQGWLGSLWEGTKDLAGDAWQGLQDLNSEYHIVERGMGVVQVVGGGAEVVLGVIGIVAPEPATTALGVVGVVHGSDTVWAGLNQVWTGEWQSTYTEQGASAVAETLGASEGAAGWIGTGVDVGVSFINPVNMGSRIVREGVEEGGEALVREGAEVLLEQGDEVLEVAGDLIDDAVEEGGTVVDDLVEEAAGEVDELADDVVEEGAEEAAEEGAEEAVEEGAENAAEDGTRVSAVQRGLSPDDFGLETIGDNPELLDKWNESLRSAASSPRENGYQRYLAALERGEVPDQKMLEEAFGAVNSRFLNAARDAGYDIAQVHHWNFPKSQFPTQIVDPRHLVPVPSRAVHEAIHRATSGTTNIWAGPISSGHQIDIGNWVTTLLGGGG